MNLTYARWLKLPIHPLEKPQKIFNVDGTENKSGELRYYTDLEVQMETTRSLLRFFLTDLGENKAILGYSWFAATQPKIDWKRGWIDSSQLPIIFRAPNAKKARFIPRTVNKPRPIEKDRYFIGKVTIGETVTEESPNIPSQYQRHAKIFSEQESQTIRPSWSPYAANFFFVKKKDGKLRPVQEYRPLNKWTKKNRNVSPLIPSVVDRLAGCTLFTKFDIRWGYNNRSEERRVGKECA